jgi:hypothetical protein
MSKNEPYGEPGRKWEAFPVPIGRGTRKKPNREGLGSNREGNREGRLGQPQIGGRRHRGDDTADPGIIPGGIRDRALRAVQRRGPQAEDKERTRAAVRYWASISPRGRTRK